MRRAATSLPQALRPLAEVGKGEAPEAPSRRDGPREQRERLLIAAARLFGERGYRHVTTDDLASAAGISPVTLYSLAKDKQDCLLAAYERVLGQVRRRILARVPADGSPKEQIEAAIAALLEEIDAAPLAARLVLLRARTAGAAGAARHRRSLAEAAEALRGCLASGPPGDVLDGFVDVAVAGADFLLADRLLDGGPGSSSLDADLRALLLPDAAGTDVRSAPALTGAVVDRR